MGCAGRSNYEFEVQACHGSCLFMHYTVVEVKRNDIEIKLVVKKVISYRHKISLLEVEHAFFCKKFGPGHITSKFLNSI